MKQFVWHTQSLQCLLHLSSGQCKVASRGLLEAIQSTGEEELCQVSSDSDEEQMENFWFFLDRAHHCCGNERLHVKVHD
jgi:hypothetical protein